jgi:hypothetical protein
LTVFVEVLLIKRDGTVMTMVGTFRFNGDAEMTFKI